MKGKRMNRPVKLSIASLLMIMILLLLVQSVSAVAPTREAIEKWVAEGVWKQKVDALRAFNAAGGNQPPEHSPLDKSHLPPSMATADEVDTLRVCVILVDFTDNASEDGFVSTDSSSFDSLLFSQKGIDVITNTTGSMTDYYWENSYGQVLIEGDIFGWFEMPSTYDYYTGYDNGLTRGRELARDAIVYAKVFGGADFSRYDNNSDGFCDGVVVIHAGRGAEEGVEGIWSHQGGLATPIEYDGVVISEYTMNPEEFGSGISGIGVFCHEYGHQLGLIDYYDTDYTPSTSDGLGSWSLMASGNYNGNSRTPSCLDAYSRVVLGWTSMIEVTENMKHVEIPASEYNQNSVYRLRNAITGQGEYWLVENRQPYGFDAALPGWGLFIYHIDLAAGNNNNYLRYMVALEQADGKNDLALTDNNGGDSGDPWPGATNNRNFNEFSNPNSNTNETGLNFGEVSTISVWDISDSDSLMYADLDITYSRPWELFSGSDAFSFDDSGPNGNGNGYLEPGETIRFYGSFINEMRVTYNARLSASTNRPEVNFVTDEVQLASVFNGFEASNLDAIEFTLASSFVPVIDSFYLTITSDSLSDTPGSNEFSKTLAVEFSLGLPQILIVDDDRGDDYDERYSDIVHDRCIPYEVWHKDDAGSPTGSDLIGYPMVFWHTGDSTIGALNATDVQAMTDYLNSNGNLFLSSISGAADIESIDADFLNDYLGIQRDTAYMTPAFAGVSGNTVGDGMKFMYESGLPSYGAVQFVTPVNGGEAAFNSYLPPVHTCGVSRLGSYNTVFLGFPMEYINDNRSGYNTCDDLIGRVLEFFGGIPTDIEDENRTVALPGSFSLSQNYPNPFNPVTTIAYTIRPTGGTAPVVDLSVYNMLGQKVTTLVNGRQIPGHYEVVWDGTTEAGAPVATGVYFYRLTHGDNTETRKMVLLK